MKKINKLKIARTPSLLIVLGILWVITFYPVYPELFDRWFTNSNYSYGVLVPFIALYFIWQKRDLLRHATISSSKWGIIVLSSSLVVYLLSYIGGIAVTMRITMIASLIGIILSILGARITRIIRFPLLFLFFMVPIPESIEMAVTLPLQLFATRAAAGVLSVLSIPFYREGNMLYFVKTQLEVAEACSGIRSITALSMLSVIFVHLMKPGWLRKAVILISTIPIAMAANILRVSGTGVLAHFFGERVARGFLHEFSGIVVFILGLAVLYLEFALLNTTPNSHSLPPSGDSSEEKNLEGKKIEPARLSIKFFSVTVLLMISSLLITTLISNRGVPAVIAFNLEKIPMELDGFNGQRDLFPQRVYDALNADENVYRHYRSAQGDQVDLYIGYYGTAKGGRTGHNPYGCLPGAGWGIIISEKLPLDSVDQPNDKKKKIFINHILARQGDKFVNMFYWYQTRGNRIIDSGIQQNIDRFLSRLLDNRNDGAFVQISTFSKEDTIESARELGRSFAVKIMTLLPSYWPIEKVPS